MCVTPFPAQLSNTTLYTAEVGDKWVIGYQNTAKTDVPNAMIFALPGVVSKESLIDTSAFPNCLKPYRDAVEAMYKKDTLRLTKSVSFGFGSDSLVETFDSGSYTVVLVQPGGSVESIKEAINQVSDEKRVDIGEDMLSVLQAYYPKWPLAFCFWNGEIDAEPLLWHFKPFLKEFFWAPALDAHGEQIDLTTPVVRDHVVVFGSDKCNRESHFEIDPDVPEEYRSLFVKTWVGKKFERLDMRGYPNTQVNGDFACRRSTVLDSSSNSLVKIATVPPPGVIMN